MSVWRQVLKFYSLCIPFLFLTWKADKLVDGFGKNVWIGYQQMDSLAYQTCKDISCFRLFSLNTPVTTVWQNTSKVNTSHYIYIFIFLGLSSISRLLCKMNDTVEGWHWCLFEYGKRKIMYSQKITSEILKILGTDG